MKKRMLDINELSFYIGLAVQTIRNQLSCGTFPIPPKKIGRKLLWDMIDIDNYLDNLEKETFDLRTHSG